MEETIKKWQNISNNYNDWFRKLAPKWTTGETIYTQTKKLLECVVDDLQDLENRQIVAAQQKRIKELEAQLLETQALAAKYIFE